MEKRTCLIDVTEIDASEISRAAALIRAGDLVAFPTETVYGLGANALDAEAVRKIYSAKGRPPDSPLIVHVDSVEMARGLVREWPEKAEQLSARFWPGPLTLILPKQPHVPDNLTAGLETVGLRMPNHPIALALIREAGVPIAAPSANRFTGLSPTTAGHVRETFGSEVAMVLDGGPAEVGIESTVLSLAGPVAVLLRPGMLTHSEIEAVIGEVNILRGQTAGAHPSPGLHRRHYSPRTPLVLVEHGRLPSSGRGAYLWISAAAEAARVIRMPDHPRDYAAVLYATLHGVDHQNWDWIAVEIPPHDPEWAAIHDRLARGAANAVIP
jgi:L-threonylcarbamoyladenylate synthase